jgi:hypothetical protein
VLAREVATAIRCTPARLQRAPTRSSSCNEGGVGVTTRDCAVPAPATPVKNRVKASTRILHSL